MVESVDKNIKSYNCIPQVRKATGKIKHVKKRPERHKIDPCQTCRDENYNV